MDGTIYEGPWRDGKRHGAHGILVASDRFCYEGSWVNNTIGAGAGRLILRGRSTMALGSPGEGREAEQSILRMASCVSGLTGT
ncbi:hypothetical protein ACHAXA_009139 [Cyclostephanos tholiformis]|uniref:Uncharacterized protein n=1 Tax=Cyclostephanos tholiformis TaxID=382380 RepID=A0ABD3RWZ4_9STRA